MSEIYHIAIDGPSASGKGTAARGLSRVLGVPCLDTGAMYRGIAVFVHENGIDANSEEAVVDSLAKIDMRVEVGDATTIFINGRNVVDKLRANEISMLASIVSKYPDVRKKMVAMQQEIAKTQSFILEGRDIASVVLPDAKFKFYLTASLKERSKRRFMELSSKGANVTFEQIRRDIKARDKNDKRKKGGALVRVRGAYVINNSRLTIGETISKMLAIINAKNSATNL